MRRLGAVFALVIGIVTATAAPAGATLLNGCPDQKMGRPFLRWLDPISYTLAPTEASRAVRRDGSFVEAPRS
jgi:hypothetical protein